MEENISKISNGINIHLNSIKFTSEFVIFVNRAPERRTKTSLNMFKHKSFALGNLASKDLMLILKVGIVVDNDKGAFASRKSNDLSITSSKSTSGDTFFICCRMSLRLTGSNFTSFSLK